MSRRAPAGGLKAITDASLTAARVARVLDRIAEERGLPQVIFCDNGPEFISKTVDRRAYGHGVKLHVIPPGRDECLNEHWFLDLADAQTKIEAWCREYNQECPHSSLDGQ